MSRGRIPVRFCMFTQRCVLVAVCLADGRAFSAAIGDNGCDEGLICGAIKLVHNDNCDDDFPCVCFGTCQLGYHGIDNTWTGYDPDPVTMPALCIFENQPVPCAKQWVCLPTGACAPLVVCLDHAWNGSYYNTNGYVYEGSPCG